jgi:hypothetical protein
LPDAISGGQKAYAVIDPEKPGFVFVYDLAADARRAFWKAHGEGRTISVNPDHMFRTRDGKGKAYALIRIEPEAWLISYASIRGFGDDFHAGVSPGEIADSLAIVELAAKLDEYERGAAVAAGREQRDEVMSNLNLQDLKTGRDLAKGYDQINSSVGQFATDTLIADSNALASGSSSGDNAYSTEQATLAQLADDRDAAAATVKKVLSDAAAGHTQNHGQITSGLARVKELLKRASKLAAG